MIIRPAVVLIVVCVWCATPRWCAALIPSNHSTTAPIDSIITKAVAKKVAAQKLSLNYLYNFHTKSVTRKTEKSDEITMIYAFHGTECFSGGTFTAGYCGFRQAGRNGIFWNPGVVNLNRQDYIEIGSSRILAPLAGQAHENYRYAVMGEITVNDYKVFDIVVTPRRPDSALMKGHLYISAEDYSIAGYEWEVTNPHLVDGRMSSLRVKQLYQLFYGGLWLPSYHTAEALYHESPAKGHPLSHYRTGLVKETQPRTGPPLASTLEIIMTGHEVQADITPGEFTRCHDTLTQTVDAAAKNRKPFMIELDEHERKAFEKLSPVMHSIEEFQREFVR